MYSICPQNIYLYTERSQRLCLLVTGQQATCVRALTNVRAEGPGQHDVIFDKEKKKKEKLKKLKNYNYKVMHATGRKEEQKERKDEKERKNERKWFQC